MSWASHHRFSFGCRAGLRLLRGWKASFRRITFDSSAVIMQQPDLLWRGAADLAGLKAGIGKISRAGHQEIGDGYRAGLRLLRGWKAALKKLAGRTVTRAQPLPCGAAALEGFPQ
ncbi:MAG: hypothetical protein WDZ59_17200 [Pirellulales bacterium]